MEYRKAVKAYIANMKADNYSPLTIEARQTHLNWFGEYMEENNIADVSSAAVVQWKCHLANTGIKITTLNTYLLNVKAFFDWAVEINMCETNPFAVKGVLPSTKSLSKETAKPYDGAILTVEDYIKIAYEAPPKSAKTKNPAWLRNKAILMLFLTTAIRNSELRALTLNDIDVDECKVHIRHGKGDKSAVIHVPLDCMEVVKAYLTSGFMPEKMKSDAPVFGTYGRGEERNVWHGYTRQGMSKLVASNVKFLCGIDGVRSHALRHTCASICLEKGMPMEAIQGLCRHSNINTTKIYAGKLSASVVGREVDGVFDGIKKEAVRSEQIRIA